MGISDLAWNYSSCNFYPFGVSGGCHWGNISLHLPLALISLISYVWMYVYIVFPFSGNISCMGCTSCFHYCYLASNRRKHSSSYYFSHVCHERQTCKGFIFSFLKLKLCIPNHFPLYIFPAGCVFGSGDRVINSDFYVYSRCFLLIGFFSYWYTSTTYIYIYIYRHTYPEIFVIGFYRFTTDSLLCDSWMDIWATCGLELSTFWDSNSVHDCSICSFHDAGKYVCEELNEKSKKKDATIEERRAR